MTNGLLSLFPNLDPSLPDNSSLPSDKAILLILLIVPLTLTLIGMSLFRSPSFSAHGRTILITGGSQGLGLSLATKLSARGASIAIVARDEAKLTSALTQIRSAARDPSKQRFLSLSYDLTSPEAAPEILRKVTEWNNSQPPDVVWMCAGYCIPSFFADASVSTLRSQMDTLYWSAAYMAHATLNLWKQPFSHQQKGSSQTSINAPSSIPRHLIFTSSALAFFPVAGYAPYSPAKSAMRALADTLQQEVAVWNGARTHKPSSPSSSSHSAQTSAPLAEIKVHTVFPMGITSPNFTHEERIKPSITKHLEESDKPQTPDEVAEAALRGLEGGRIMIATLALGKLMMGAGMASSIRMSLGDVLWNWLGSLVVIFVGWDFLAKARKWGRERGMVTGPDAVGGTT